MVCGLRGEEGDPFVAEGLSKPENILCRTTAAVQKYDRATRTFEIVAGVSNRHVGMRVRHLLALFAGEAIQLAKAPVRYLRGGLQARAAAIEQALLPIELPHL